uniref:Uncharacterized protein n=1 Tax=Onchocerca volvulus TaxID=6282 RepID=A0A8R1TZB4_ONCVO
MCQTCNCLVLAYPNIVKNKDSKLIDKLINRVFFITADFEDLFCIKWMKKYMCTQSNAIYLFFNHNS